MRLITFGGLKLEEGKSKPKNLLLLAYLAVEGPKTRQHLAELFFMGRANPRGSLSRVLSDLRKDAPDSIEADNHKVCFVGTSDVGELLDFLDNNKVEKSVELYRGAFADGVSLIGETELEEWALGTREYLATRATEAFLQLAEVNYQNNNRTQASSYAEQAYTLSDELGIGLQPDQYQRIYVLLKGSTNIKASDLMHEAAEIGIELYEPNDESSFSEKTKSIPHNLPNTRTSFIGRTQELEEIKKLLINKDCRLLTLHGMGGIGKSRLAIQAAFEQLENDSFQDGIYFIALDALNSADLIPIAIADVLNVDLHGLDDTIKSIQKFIDNKSMLLILDNYEHLMEGATLPSNILEACSNLKIIVTSREILSLEEEWVNNLDGLNYPRDNRIEVEDALKYDAVELFTLRARQSKNSFQITEDNLSDLIDICLLVEGIPLAIELSAVWVNMMPIEQISKEINENIDFLKNQNRNHNERHESMWAVFEHSWKLLTETERNVLRRLAFFEGGFSRKAAVKVANATLPNLVSFVNKSLLQNNSTGRLTKHFLIQEYLNKKLKEDLDLKTITKKNYSEYYFEYLANLEQAIGGENQKAVLEELDLERSNICKAWKNYYEITNSEQQCLAANVFCEYMSIKKRQEEGISIFEETLVESESHVDKGLAFAILEKCLAWLLSDIGQYQKARVLIEHSFSLFESLNNTSEQIWTLRIAYAIYSDQGDYNQAYKCLLTQMTLFDHDNDLKSQAITSLSLGILQLHLGEYIEAEISIKKSIEINHLEGCKSDYGVAYGLYILGTLYLAVGKFVEAKSVFVKSISISESVGFKDLLPNIINQLGRAYYYLGHKELANQQYSLAFRQAKTSQNTVALISIHQSFARIHFDKGNFAKCEEYLVISLKIAEENSVWSEVLKCLFESVSLLLNQHNPRLAKEVLQYIITANEASYKLKESAHRLWDNVYIGEFKSVPRNYSRVSKLSDMAENLISRLTPINAIS